MELHGWIYDIKTGQVNAFDEASNTFLPVTERYAQEIAKLTVPSGCGG